MDDKLGSYESFNFNNENFRVWKQPIELVSAYRVLDNLITEDSATASDKKKGWNMSDARARAIIRLSSSGANFEYIRDVMAVKDMYKEILSVF